MTWPERAALRLTAWTEKWIPDAFIFALGATLLVFLAGLASGATPTLLVESWGKGFWDLLGFSMQMVLIIVGGYVVASAGPVQRLIFWLAQRLDHPRRAVAAVAAFSLITSWFNWGFSLIFSAVLAREIGRRQNRVDYRALGAASLLGLGSIWAQGLSGSAALQMATAGALPPYIRDVVAQGGLVPGGVISFKHTIFLWQSLLSVAIELVVVTGVMYFVAPVGDAVRSAVDLLGSSLAAESETRAPAPRSLRPGEWLEHSPWLSRGVVAIGGAYLAITFWRGGFLALTLNTINLTFLLLGLLLHRTPARMMAAVQKAVPATWGVVLQFPFYAGIAGMIALTKLNEQVAHLFVRISTPKTFPALMSLYSAVLGVFVPSGGSKWIIEAPYVMKAAHELKIHLGWVVACYDLGEAVANLIQPFWMLPVLSLLGLRARDVMGYTFVVFLVLLPLVLVMSVLLGSTLGYPL